MHWWEEAEARAHRAKSSAALAQVLYQRMLAAGIDADLAFVPAYDLAGLHDLAADLVKLVEGFLVTADGDKEGLRRQGLVLARWAEQAHAWTVASAPAFNQLMDGLELESDRLAEREAAGPDGNLAGAPEEQPKVEGRYRHWHLLYERLDLKLASVGLEAAVCRSLARLIARIYEQCLLTVRTLHGLEKESSPRFRATARLLLELNTAWHFDLGPYHLGAGRLRARGASAPGLQTWLMIAFSR